MSTPEWDTTLVSPALTLDGQTAQILTGRLRRHDRHVTVLRAGDTGPILVLLPAAAHELVDNIQTLEGGDST